MEFIRGLQTNIDSKQIKDGELLLAVDSNRLFIDTTTERIEITDFVKGLTSEEILSLESPLPKVYLSSDNNKFYVYDFRYKEWIIYGGVAASDTVVDIAFDGADTVLIYGNGRTVSITNPKIYELESRIADLETIISNS